MDGTFKHPEALREIYSDYLDRESVSYCRIGERSSITWFVLNDCWTATARTTTAPGQSGPATVRHPSRRVSEVITDGGHTHGPW